MFTKTSVLELHIRIIAKTKTMTLFDQIRRIERLDYFIRSRSTGTPAELAVRLGISESQCYSLIKQLREKFKAPIYYSRKECRYCYEGNVEFVFGFIRKSA